jgi:uncharacterized protein (TIGR02453 family)
MKSEILDAEMYPPFAGFPREGIKFLKQLKKNNNREWFTRHKPEYEEFVKLPMQSLIASLREPMADVAPEFDVHPKRSLFRIYRDIRFSNNKAPYKTHVAAVFHLRGNWQGSAGYYLHIEPGQVFLGGGMYMPDSNQLKNIRGAISDHQSKFRSIVEDKSFKKKFGGLEGEKLKRNPLGYSADHPMIEWLKYKQFFSGVEWEEKSCYSPRMVGSVVDVYKGLLPLIRFLNEAMGK